MNTRLIGSHYLPKLIRRTRETNNNGINIPHKTDEPYAGPSITNPDVAILMENQKNTLGAYLGQIGNVRATTIRDLQFHPLHRKIPIPRDIIHVLTSAAETIFKRL